MKKQLLYISILLAGLSLASCEKAFEKFLTTPTQSAFADDVVFSDPVLADGALMGAYNMMMENNSYRNRTWVNLGYNTDCEMHNSSLNGVSEKTRRSLAIYKIERDNSEMQGTDGADPYSRIYTAIERLNIIIKGIRAYGDLDNRDMAHVYGEALCLRAHFYFDLIKWWGDVPARFEPVSNTTIYVEKSDRDLIYKQIIGDLGEAIPLLPWPNDSKKTQSVERMSKAYAKGLRARICLAAGGYALRPDINEMRLSKDPDLSRTAMYTIARQECLDIMNSNKCLGMASFEQIFRDNLSDVVTAGRESIYEMPYSNTRGQQLSFYGSRHDDADKYTTAVVKGEAGPTPTLWYNYDAKDLRRDVTCVPYKYKGGKQLIQDNVNTPSVKTWYFGKLRAEWTSRKMTSNDDGVNPIIMRYADILLMFAEADNELNNGPSTAAKDALKEVRRRAFAAGDHAAKVETYVNNLSGKEDFFKAIVDERAFEFTGEMLRKYDLIRWNLLKTKLDETKNDLADLRNATGKYNDCPKYIFWRRNAQNDEIVEIFGLKRGEYPLNDQQEVIDPENSLAIDLWRESYLGGGWKPYCGTGANQRPWLNPDPEKSEISDNYIQNAVYLNGVNPNLRSLLPFFDCVLVNSQGHLKNDYGY